MHTCTGNLAIIYINPKLITLYDYILTVKTIVHAIAENITFVLCWKTLQPQLTTYVAIVTKLVQQKHNYQDQNS